MAMKIFLVALIAALSVQGLVEARHLRDEEYLINRQIEIVVPEILGSPVECVLAQKENIVALGKQVRSELVACGTVDGLEEIVAELVQLQDKAADRALELIQELRACNDLNCKKEVVTKAIGEAKELGKKVRALVAQATELVQNAAPEIANCARGVLQNAVAEARNIVDAVRECIKTLKNAFISDAEIEKLVPEVLGSPVECVLAQRENVVALGQQLRSDLVACGTVDGLEEIVAELVELDAKASARIVELINELRACGDNECRKEVVQKAISEAMELNQKVRALLAEAVELVQSAAPEIASCARAALQKAVAEAQTIVQNIRECIKSMKTASFSDAEIEKVVPEVLGSPVECVLAQKENIVALAKDVKDALKVCGSVAGLDEIAAELVELNQRATARALELINELRACGDNDCRKEVLKKAIAEAKELRQKVRALVAQAAELVQGAAPEIASCVNDVLAAAAIQASVIVQNVKDCVRGEASLMSDSEIEDLVPQLLGSPKECILEQQDKLIALAKKVRSELLACKDGVSSELKGVLAELEELLQKAKARALELVNEIRACGDNDCKKEVLKKAISEAKELRNKLRSLAVEAAEIIQSSGAVQCVIDVHNNNNHQLGDIIREIKACIKN